MSNGKWAEEASMTWVLEIDTDPNWHLWMSTNEGKKNGNLSMRSFFLPDSYAPRKPTPAMEM